MSKSVKNKITRSRKRFDILIGDAEEELLAAQKRVGDLKIILKNFKRLRDAGMELPGGEVLSIAA